MSASPLFSSAAATAPCRANSISLSVSKEVLNLIRSSLSEAVSRWPRLCHGSLLLGVEISNPQGGSSFFIRNHMPLEWDTTRGGAPFLTDSQWRSLNEVLASLSTDGKVIGFCRTSRRSESENMLGAGVLVAELIEADTAILAACAQNSSAAITIKFGPPPKFQSYSLAMWQDGSIVQDLEIKRPPPTPAIPSPPADARIPPTSSPSRIYAVLAWMMGTILLSIATYVIAHLYLKPAMLHWAMQTQTEAAPPATRAAQSGFGLRVEPSGTALEVRWDPLSPALQAASSATLVITEGTSVRRVPLEADQIRAGRLLYTSVLGDVIFRLDALDSNSHMLSESLRVIRNGGLPAPSVSAAGPLPISPPHHRSRTRANGSANSYRFAPARTPAPEPSLPVPVIRLPPLQIPTVNFESSKTKR
ncbi:MAG TPA: hypothetical protein VFM77_09820 [Terriglobales bacterium]|nr:hypothetical protein [Terriglobales bacterium]